MKVVQIVSPKMDGEADPIKLVPNMVQDLYNDMSASSRFIPRLLPKKYVPNDLDGHRFDMRKDVDAIVVVPLEDGCITDRMKSYLEDYPRPMFLAGPEGLIPTNHDELNQCEVVREKVGSTYKSDVTAVKFSYTHLIQALQD